jgi:uncharacterized protein (TIGR00299 family) protein
MTCHLHIDPFSGIAGDMFLGALLDAGASADDVAAAFDDLPVREQFELMVARVQRHAISATDLKVRVIANHHNHGHSHHHHHVHYPALVTMVDALRTTDRGRQRARRIIDALARAEARVHGVAIEKVHFHEVGAVDSIVDMLGSAVAMELLNIESVSAGPLPLSRGFIKCQHGRMPLPAPATAYLMQGLPTVGVDREGELVTPTGAAIVAAVADTFGPSPAMTVDKIGYGAGDRDDPDYPNLLRVFIGTLTAVQVPVH